MEQSARPCQQTCRRAVIRQVGHDLPPALVCTVPPAINQPTDWCHSLMGSDTMSRLALTDPCILPIL